MSSNSRALMLSYPFPPALSGGVFRILRFCKYLPEFGWEPIVLTPRTEAVHPIELDPTLEALVPDGLQVVRTGVLRPNVVARRALRNAQNRLARQLSTPASVAAASGGSSTSGEVQAAP